MRIEYINQVNSLVINGESYIDFSKLENKYNNTTYMNCVVIWSFCFSLLNFLGKFFSRLKLMESVFASVSSFKIST